MASYNRTRYVEDLLERTEAKPPSFTVHLHMEYWTLNNGSKFLYNNQIASLLDDVRAHRIPVDFLDLFEAANVPFYDGCMVVELLDYRPQRTNQPNPEKPDRTRVVLHPNGETLWADICALNKKEGLTWTDMDAIEVEAKILLATTPPLCLDPDPHLARVANHILRVSTPTVPVSLKRKASAMDAGEEESEKARRAKIMSFLNPKQTRGVVAPTYRILDFMQNYRAKQAANANLPPQPQPTPAANPYMTNPVTTTLRTSASPQKPPTPSVVAPSHANSPIEVDDKKKTVPTPQIPYAAPSFIQRTSSQTPAPTPAPTHQFINAHPHARNVPSPAPPPATHVPMQPVTYPSVQAATEANKRASTPAQRPAYVPSRPPTAVPVPQPTPQPQPISNTTIQQAINNQYLATMAARGAQNPTAKQPQPISAAPSTQGNAPQQGQPGQQIIMNQGAQNPAANPQQQHQFMMLQQQHQQRLYAQSMQQKAAAAAAAATGRATPQQQAQLNAVKAMAGVTAQNSITGGAGGAAPQVSPVVSRASPMVTNQTVAARSPMPANNQLPGHQHTPQQQAGQPGQHIQHGQQPQQAGNMAAGRIPFPYNPALLQSVVPGTLPPQLANIVAAGQQAQQQAQQAQQAASAALASQQQANNGGDAGHQQQQTPQTQAQQQQQQQMALQALYSQQMLYGYMQQHQQQQQQQQQQGGGGNTAQNLAMSQQYQQQYNAAHRFWQQAQNQAQNQTRGTPIPGMQQQPQQQGVPGAGVAGMPQANMTGKVPNQGR